MKDNSLLLGPLNTSAFWQTPPRPPCRHRLWSSWSLGQTCCLAAQLCLCDPRNCSSPGYPVHGIFQARVLEKVAISFSRGHSQPRDRTCITWIGRQIFYHWASREASQFPTNIYFILGSIRRIISPQTEMHIWMSYPLFSNLNSKPISGISSWNLGDHLTTLTKSIWHSEAVPVRGKAMNGLGASLQFAERQLDQKGVTEPGEPGLRSLSPRGRLWGLRHPEERRHVNQETKQPGNRSQPQDSPPLGQSTQQALPHHGKIWIKQNHCF